jgi:hypothetical protein
MAGLSRACARLTLGRPSPVPLAVLGLPRSRRLHEAIPAAAEAAAPLVGAGMAHFLSLSPPLAAQVLFLSPMQAIRQFRTDGTTGSVSSLPYAAMAANGVAWTAYGALGSDPTIMLANMPPALLGVYYCSVFYKYRADGAVALPYFAGAAAFSTAVAVAAITLPAATAKMAIGCAFQQHHAPHRKQNSTQKRLPTTKVNPEASLPPCGCVCRILLSPTSRTNNNNCDVRRTAPKTRTTIKPISTSKTKPSPAANARLCSVARLPPRRYGGVAVCTIMFGGPLASIKDVLRERSAHSLPLAYTLAGVANCT